jgi:hypothetical protein
MAFWATTLVGLLPQRDQAGIKRLIISASVVPVPAPARRLAKPVHDGHPHSLFRH